MNTDLYNIRHIWQHELCGCGCTAGFNSGCLAFTVTSHFNKQPLMNLHSYRKPSVMITGM